MNIKEFSSRHSVTLFYSTIIFLILTVVLAFMAFGHRGFAQHRQGAFGSNGGYTGAMQMQGGQPGGMGGGYGQGQRQGRMMQNGGAPAAGSATDSGGAAVPPAPAGASPAVTQ